MPLGRFGGTTTDRFRAAGGSGIGGGDGLVAQAREHLTPSPEGMPALSQQLAQYLAGFWNYLVGGSVESWSNGPTAAPDGWTLTGTGATIARTTSAGDVQEGQAAANVTNGANNTADLSQTLLMSATVNTRLRGREVTFACRVNSSTVSRAFLRVDDGVGTKDSRYHVGDGNHETLRVSFVVDAAATQLKVSGFIAAGAAITVAFDCFKLEDGATATAFTPHPFDAFLKPRQVTGTSTVTSSSTTFAEVDGMSLANVILNGNQSVLAIFTYQVSADTAGNEARIRILRGSTNLLPGTDEGIHEAAVALKVSTKCVVVYDNKPAAGTYTYSVQHRTGNAAVAVSINIRELNLVVLPEP